MLSSPNSAHSPRTSSAARQIDDACRQVVAGKQAARDLTHWIGGVGVGETEFRLLWLLFPASDPAVRCVENLPDQAELAARLAVSPAQVSGAVERLRSLQLVERHLDGADRRRQTWRLSDGGRALIHTVLHLVGSAASREAA